MSGARTPGAEPGTEAAEAPFDYRPPYRWALGVGLGVFVLYVITLAPTTAFWDTSEYIATAHIVGIPHPPGNPVFVLLARTWELLLAPLPLSTAVKINLFSATNSAVAAGFWFLVAHRVLAFFAEDELFRRVGAIAATVLSATAFTVWNQSVVNEKVYTVSLMTIALLTWLIFRWRDNLGRGKDDNLLVLIVFLLALSVGNHLMAFLAAPALAVYVIWVHPQVLGRWRLYAFAALAWALGLSAQLALPIRAEDRPVINEAAPTCESMVDATADIITFGRADACPALAASLRREQYGKPPLTTSPVLYPGRDLPRDFHLIRWQFLNYLQYFDWQWARRLDGENHFLAPLRAPFTLLIVFLGLFGAWRHYQEDRTSWVYFAVLFATVSVGLVIYLNFKYGFTVPARVGIGGQTLDVPFPWREVRERDYFYIVSFSHWGIWSGIGLAALWQRLAGLLASAKARLARADYARAAPIMLLALLPMVLNWTYASRAGNHAARDWAYNILMSVEPYGILFTNGDNDTFPLWYLQEAEGLRQDVTVIVYSYLATPWYARQLRDLTRPCNGKDPLADPTTITCQRPFEPGEAIPMYRDRDWEKPDRPILEMTDAEITGIPDCYPIDQLRGRCQAFADTMVVPIGNVEGFVPAGQGLYRNDILVLRILQTAMGDRPIYFAGTTGTYESFALQPYMVRHGTAFKLVNHALEPNDTITPLPPPERIAGNRVQPFWVDTATTRELLTEHYIYRDVTEWDFWPDASTRGIPLQYFQAFRSLAAIEAMAGREESARELYERGVDFVEVAVGRERFRSTARPSAPAAPAATPPGSVPTQRPPPTDTGSP